MLEPELLLQAAVAVLLVCLAWHAPGVRRCFGRGALAWPVAGALLPLLDLLVLLRHGGERIAFLARTPWFTGLPAGAMAVVAVALVAAFVLRPRHAWGAGQGMALGFGLHLGLAALSPAGIPAWAPYEPGQYRLAAFPAGHLPLLVLLVAAVVLLETRPRARPRLRQAALLGLAVYLAAGLGGYAAAWTQLRDVPPQAAPLHLYPTGGWPLTWMAVRAGPRDYTVYTHRLRPGQGRTAPPVRIARTDDPALLARWLGDIRLRRLYFRVFRHPVVNTRQGERRVTLLVRELTPQGPVGVTRTLVLETDRRGRNARYSLQGFP